MEGAYVLCRGEKEDSQSPSIPCEPSEVVVIESIGFLSSRNLLKSRVLP